MSETLMQTLSVALGMSLMFSLLSLLASSAVELLLAWLDLRPQMLVKSLNEILAGASTDGEFANKLLNHPLNRGLRNFGSRTQQPAYLSSAGFATALLDLLAPASPDLAHDKASLRQTLGAISDPDFRAMMLGIVDETDGKLDAVKSRLAEWFDNVQEQVRGCYARRSRLVLIVVAVVMVSTMNIDAIRIGSALWYDPELRARVAAAAEDKAKEQASPNDGAGGTTPKLGATTRPSATAGTISDDAAKQTRFVTAREAFHDTREEFLALGLPIGWTREEFGSSRDCLEFVALIANKTLGLALTVLAISLGAPFWFDILNKLVSLRANAGAKPMTEEDRTAQRKPS